MDIELTPMNVLKAGVAGIDVARIPGGHRNDKAEQKENQPRMGFPKGTVPPVSPFRSVCSGCYLVSVINELASYLCHWSHRV